MCVGVTLGALATEVGDAGCACEGAERNVRKTIKNKMRHCWWKGAQCTEEHRCGSVLLKLKVKLQIVTIRTISEGRARQKPNGGEAHIEDININCLCE